jgi:hypothetical protein
MIELFQNFMALEKPPFIKQTNSVSQPSIHNVDPMNENNNFQPAAQGRGG